VTLSEPKSTLQARWGLPMLGIWCGLLTGTIALGVTAALVAFSRWTSPSPLGLEVGWLNAPLVDAISFGLVGLAFYVAAWRWPRLASFRTAAFALSFFAFSSLLFLIPGLAWYSLLLLAGGCAVQVARFTNTRQAALARVCRVTLPWLLLLAIGAAAWDTGGPWIADTTGRKGLPPASPGAPNVLLIVLDTVRAESLSAYGFEEPTSPWLERFAKDAVLFEHALSTSPWTLPSHGTLFTGRAPRELSTDWESALDGTYPTLAEIFAKHGYLTGGFVANYDFASGRTGLDRGFLRYDDHTAIKTLVGHTYDSRARTSSSVGRLGTATMRRIMDDLGHKNAVSLNGEFLNWLSGRNDRPVFAFLNYYDAHSPYRAPERYDAPFAASSEDVRGQTRLNAYESCIAFLDDQLQQLFQQLGQSDFLRNTVVIITSDHGELFGEHGVSRHGNSLYRQALEVPLVVALPGSMPGGTRVSEVVSLRDVAATILDLTGIEPGDRIPGKSLRRYWTREVLDATARPEPALSEVTAAVRQPRWLNSKGPMISVVENGLHYIKNFGRNEEELYDFLNDPRELRNLIDSPEAASQLPPFRARIGPAATASTSLEVSQ
jgi:arylsulfatase A-like enzyme